MTFPESVLRATQTAEAKHPGDVQAATAAAIKAVRKLPEFEEVVAALVDHAIQGLVYDFRHRRNVQIKSDAGSYGRPAKVRVGESRAVERAYESVYSYRIGGVVLGDVLGGQLPALADKEAELAAGHEFNRRLLLWCASRGLKDDQRVRDVIPEKELTATFARLQKSQRTDGRGAA